MAGCLAMASVAWTLASRGGVVPPHPVPSLPAMAAAVSSESSGSATSPLSLRPVVRSSALVRRPPRTSCEVPRSPPSPSNPPRPGTPSRRVAWGPGALLAGLWGALATAATAVAHRRRRSVDPRGWVLAATTTGNDDSPGAVLQKQHKDPEGSVKESTAPRRLSAATLEALSPRIPRASVPPAPADQSSPPLVTQRTPITGRPTYVHWDLESVRPFTDCHPAAQVQSIHRALTEASLPPVHTVVAYPSIETLHRLVKQEVFDDFDDEEEINYWPYRDIEPDPTELRIWITEWASVDESPYQCPYCGKGGHWTRDNRLLAKHVKRHGIALLAEYGVEVERRRSTKTHSPTQLATHVNRNEVVRTLGDDMRLGRWLAARRKVFEWSIPFRKKESLERLMRSGGLRANVVMPSPPSFRSAMERDLDTTIRLVTPGNLCLITEDPRYLDVVMAARQAGWYVQVVSSHPLLTNAADAVLPLESLLSAGVELEPKPSSEAAVDEEALRDPDNVEDWWAIDRNTSRGGYYNEHINPQRNIWKTYK